MGPPGGVAALLEGIPKKVKIIVNPNAGGGKGRKLFPLLRQKLLDRKVSFHLQFAESAEHVTHLCRQALGEGYNYIVSCGGDGTHHRALQAMVGNRFILGFIPMGTGNDFPANLGIPNDLDSACDLLLKGKTPETAKFADGYHWFFAGDHGGPFGTLDEALNDFVDGHEAPEE